MNENNNTCFCFSSPCEAVTALTALALYISQGKTKDEISLLGTYFSQLGDTLETIAAVSSCDQNSQ